MKKLLFFIVVAIAFVVSTDGVRAEKPVVPPGQDKQECVSIQDGVLTYSAGHYLDEEPLVVGYDDYGYNYQAHFFKGSYANVYLGGAGYPPYEGDDDSYLANNPSVATHWAWPYRDVNLSMKWNDAWIANLDCDNDGKLDRHYGFSSYIGSGAWETNHMWGENEDGSNWNYYTKIVAVPEDAVNNAGVWFTADGDEIGPVLWGEFATIMEVSNDPSLDDHGLLYKGDLPGFGMW